MNKLIQNIKPFTNGRIDYTLILIDATTAHRNKIVQYKKDGTVILKHPKAEKLLEKKEAVISIANQYPAIFATFMDLGKALSKLANSPLVEGESLRGKFDKEFTKYRELVDQAQVEGKWEPDYGTYVFDPLTGNLYLIAPEYWHRLGLVTNTAKLITDPKKELTWKQIREKLDSAVIGFAGASVGGNILEGWMREGRPKRVKVADLDWEEVTNLNRLERGTIRHLVGSRDKRQNPKNPYELVRVNKAIFAAYEHSLVDPYTTWDVYSSGLNSENLERFFLGDGKDEPRIDVFVEEIDNFTLKYETRKLCRQYGIPVLMLSDFGHRVQVQFQDFRKNSELKLGYKVSDQEVEAAVNRAMSSGNREDVFKFVRALCGEDFAQDEFAMWVNGDGEQPTSSLPQSGATALASGGIGGKILAHYILGHEIPERFIYDFKRWEVITE